MLLNEPFILKLDNLVPPLIPAIRYQERYSNFAPSGHYNNPPVERVRLGITRRLGNAK